MHSFRQAGDFPLDLDGTTGSALKQFDGALDLVALQDANGFDRHDD